MTPAPAAVRALVGGVSELYQGDLDFGRRVVEALAAEPFDDGVLVEDLHYGAVAITQRLQDIRPALLVIVGAAARGRPPGSLERRRVEPAGVDPQTLRGVVADAVTGYVGIDLLTEVAEGLGALPPRTVAIELEPVATEPSVELSQPARQAVPAAVALVCREVERGPLLELADRVRERLAERRLAQSAALQAVEALLAALATLDHEGRWAGAFAARDHLRLAIATGATSDGMDHLDWVQWWALIEELDRLQRAEAAEA